MKHPESMSAMFYRLVTTWLCGAGLLCAAPSTYYVDWTSGSDANSGTSKATPWKRHPYMNGFSGTYAHQAGDVFIFKGGSTWPNAAFAFIITKGGTANQPDRYTVDRTWYQGAEWTRPVFDLENKASANSFRPFVIENVSWVVIDGIEITRQRIDQGQEMFAGGIYLYDSENVVITNCYLHDWYVASTSDGMYGGVITLFCSNVVVDACHIRGTIVTAPDKGSGAGYYGNSTVADIIKNCEIHDTSQGIFGANIVHDCHIHHIRDSFNTSQHENGVWLNPGCVFYNNIVHDLQSGTSVYPNPGYGGSAPIWVYNNLVFNTLVVPIGVDPSATSADMVMKVYIHNNTIRGDSVCVNMGLRSVGPVNTLDVRNNFFITPSTDPVTVTHPVLDLTVENNIQLSPLAAASAGFVEDAYFAPRSVESPTVDSGIDLSSFFQADLRGIARPQLKAWDIGAYEFVGISVPRTSSDRLLNRRE